VSTQNVTLINHVKLTQDQNSRHLYVLDSLRVLVTPSHLRHHLTTNKNTADAMPTEDYYMLQKLLN
jgi:hypothetical protein